MKIRTALLLLAALVSSPALLLAQGAPVVRSDVTVEGADAPHVRDLRPVPGGGFVAAGYRDLPDAGGSRMYLARLDTAGDVVWEKTLESDEPRWAQSVAVLPAGGFVLAGSHVVRTDAGGEVLGERPFPGQANSVQATRDGGIIVAGTVTQQIYLLRLDPAGEEAWDLLFDRHGPGPTEGDQGDHVIELAGGGFAVAGAVWPGADLEAGYRAVLAGVTPEGGAATESFFRAGDLGHETAASFVLETAGGGFLVAGIVWPFTLENTADAWLVKTDAGGGAEWARSYDRSRHDRLVQVLEAPGGGFLLVGKSAPGGGFLLRTDGAGNGVWEWSFADFSPARAERSEEGGYLVVGDVREGFEFVGARRLRLAPEEPTIFRRADANDDGKLDIADGLRILNFLFLGAAEPSCFDAFDANDSGALDISDGVMTFLHLFVGGSAPGAPFPACGFDPTGDRFDCAAYARC
jgi:hypothetical protein